MPAWHEVADAWVRHLGEHGDYGRRAVLDPALQRHVEGHGFRRALDVGCGEGRACRMMRGWGIEPVGVDPTTALIDRARSLDDGGDYRIGRAEALEFDDHEFDLVLSCLSLIDIDGLEDAIGEMTRVLAPGGSLVVMNLNSFMTSVGRGLGWRRDLFGHRKHFAVDRYLDQRRVPGVFSGATVDNTHRPLSTYMTLFLNQGLRLRAFEEPEPDANVDPASRAKSYRRMPWFHVMRWERPRSA
ncbi:MAG: class I SAM-dependent methyltransferase [Planctomycetota bacterium]